MKIDDLLCKINNIILTFIFNDLAQLHVLISLKHKARLLNELDLISFI